MAGTEGLGDIGVILATLVLVADEQRDRRAGGQAFIDAGENLDRIGLTPLRDMARGARFASVELGLDVGLADRQPRRASIDHTADRRTMRFAKRRNAKQLA